MIIAKKNAAYYLSFPAIDSASPASYKQSVTPVALAYSQDGAGVWTLLTISDPVSEIGSTGVYEITLSATEMNHDKIIIKFSVSGMADDAYLFNLRGKLTDDLNDAITAPTATAIVDEWETQSTANPTGFRVNVMEVSSVAEDIATETKQDIMDTNVDDIETLLGTVNTNVNALPTATENADGLLNRDMATGTDSGSTTVRTVRQALRFLRNYWDISGTTLTVRKEDDSTASWTATVATSASADPVTGSNPAGGS